MIERFSIVGCGWTGIPLAKLLHSKGKLICGSTTTKEKLSVIKNTGARPFLFELTPETSTFPDELSEAEALILTIPPRARKKGKEYYPGQLRQICRFLEKSPVRKIIFFSSTSVYPMGGVYNEESITTPEESGNPELLECERMVNNLPQDCTILRCGGLTGPGRILVNHFAGRKNIKGGCCPVNLVHLDDVINVVWHVIEKEIWNETINVTAPEHPLKKDYYSFLAQQFNLPAPGFIGEDKSSCKSISSEKLTNKYGYSFIYRDPFHFSF